jgi:hypothetical protein
MHWRKRCNSVFCLGAQVLEPKNPGRDCVSRRIAVGDNCLMQLVCSIACKVPSVPSAPSVPGVGHKFATLHAKMSTAPKLLIHNGLHVLQDLHVGAPTTLPKIQFLGADRVIAPLRHALNANFSCWHGARTTRLNLEAVLGITFPKQPGGADKSSSYGVECAICYCYQLEDSVPESACDECGKPFHRSCLSEWLRGLATTQQSFNRLFGKIASMLETPTAHN